MEVDRLEIELEILRQKRALADRCQKLRETYANDRLDWRAWIHIALALNREWPNHRQQATGAQVVE